MFNKLELKVLTNLDLDTLNNKINNIQLSVEQVSADSKEYTDTKVTESLQSNYDLWLSLGYEGTPHDFIEFLRGDSAYEIWLKQEGNAGKTEEDFLNFLSSTEELETLINKKPGLTVEGKSYIINGVTVTAGTGAEVFNNCEYNKASGEYSHAEGYNTIASSNNQHVQGKYNIEDTTETYAHIVGNGNADDNRSNAHTVDWNGNAWYAGDIYVGGTSQDDTNASKLATESFVNNALSGFTGGSTTLDGLTAIDISGLLGAENAVVNAQELINKLMEETVALKALSAELDAL